MTQVYLAFYKGRPRKGDSLKIRLMHISDWLIRKVTNSRYSHCEVAIASTTREGVYHCCSASIRDGGVREKWMYLPGERWDLIRVDTSADDVETFFDRTKGDKYDWPGIFRFLLPFIPQSPKRWFCSEWCAWAIGIRDNPSKYSPGKLAQEAYKY